MNEQKLQSFKKILTLHSLAAAGEAKTDATVLTIHDQKTLFFIRVQTSTIHSDVPMKENPMNIPRVPPIFPASDIPEMT